MDLGRFFEYGYGNKDYRGSFLRREGGGRAKHFFLTLTDSEMLSSRFPLKSKIFTSLTILTLWSEYKGSKVGIDERD